MSGQDSEQRDTEGSEAAETPEGDTLGNRGASESRANEPVGVYRSLFFLRFLRLLRALRFTLLF
jgi:hypothetical protein